MAQYLLIEIDGSGSQKINSRTQMFTNIDALAEAITNTLRSAPRCDSIEAWQFSAGEGEKIADSALYYGGHRALSNNQFAFEDSTGTNSGHILTTETPELTNAIAQLLTPTS